MPTFNKKPLSQTVHTHYVTHCTRSKHCLPFMHDWYALTDTMPGNSKALLPVKYGTCTFVHNRKPQAMDRIKMDLQVHNNKKMRKNIPRTIHTERTPLTLCHIWLPGRCKCMPLHVPHTTVIPRLTKINRSVIIR
jgi:hypothetical protein